MKIVTCGTTPTKIDDAGPRDFINIYNNGANTVFLCYDGNDPLSSPPQAFAVIVPFSNTGVYTSIVLIDIGFDITPGMVLNGTGIPTDTVITNVIKGKLTWLGITYNSVAITVSFTATADYKYPVLVGPAPLTVNNGWPVPAGSWFTFNNDANKNSFNKAIYAISAAGGEELRIQGA